MDFWRLSRPTAQGGDFHLVHLLWQGRFNLYRCYEQNARRGGKTLRAMLQWKSKNGKRNQKRKRSPSTA